MPNLVRSDKDLRLSDYKKSFQFWINHKHIKKIIMIENTGYDLDYFRKIASKLTDKETEIISSNSNESFDKKLGKGYVQHLCLKEIFEKSQIVKNTNFFIDITGRHIVKNFKKILDEIIKERPDIYLNLTDNLKFADTNIYGGTKIFFEEYVIPDSYLKKNVMVRLYFIVGKVGTFLLGKNHFFIESKYLVAKFTNTECRKKVCSNRSNCFFVPNYPIFTFEENEYWKPIDEFEDYLNIHF